MNVRKKRKLRYFWLSFAMAFFVLSLSFYMLMNAVHPKIPASLSQDVEVETEPYLPSREEGMSVLFVGVGADGMEAGTFLLARFDPMRGKVPLVVFPPETVVQRGGKSQTLAECFRYGGAGYTRDALGDTLGVTINRYVRMDERSFIVAAGIVGTVEFQLDQPMTLGQSGSMPITLSKGNQLMDGKTVAQIIGYEGYKDSLERCRVVSGLAETIINQRLDIALSTVVDQVFEKIINLIDTDISYPDYDNRKAAAQFLARLGQDPAVAIQVAGQYSTDQTTYHLTDTFAALMTQTFS